jgi:TIR domain/Carboxypeptidase regulatory-like domain
MPGVFICYRREDVAGHAGRLFERLAGRFGSDRVFMDVDSLEPGVRWDLAIERAISNASVVLVLIGPKWMEHVARLSEPADFVRNELTMAMRLEVPLIPVLIEGTRCPSADELPEPLRELARREAIELAHATFSRDADGIAAALGRFVSPSPEARRGRLVTGLEQAGWPCTWIAPLIRTLSVAGTIAAAAVLVAGLWTATVVGTWMAARQAGVEAGRLERDAYYEEVAFRERSRALFINGRVKDPGQGDIAGASVTITNRESGATDATTTNQDGDFAADLTKVGVTQDTPVQLDVRKPSYQPYQTTFRVRDGHKYNLILRPAGGTP